MRSESGTVPALTPTPAAAAGAPAAPFHDYVAQLGRIPHDARDPDPWLALHLDPGLPFDPQAKAALIMDARSFSRRFVLPLARPIARTMIVFFALFRLFLPRALASSRFLHWLIYVGLRTFVSPAANFLILRHFHLGAQIVAFVNANAPRKVETTPLAPLRLADVKDDLFLRHDLNLYNFIIRLNQALRDDGTGLTAPARIDFDPISDAPIPFEQFPNRWTNFLDLFSAIELYTPLYQLLLTQRDFNRANHSLQLDETMAIYTAQILGDATHLALVNNRHPLVPLSALRAGFRLVIHGLGTELLHAVLARHKQSHAAGAPTGLGLRGVWQGPAGKKAD
jgi:hypothetical protein